MVVAPLALDRLEDDRGDVVRIVRERALHLRDRERLTCLDVLKTRLVERELDLRIENPGPVELREERRLLRLGRIGERERIAGASVERLLEVEDLRPALFPVAAREVLPDLPVERRL